MEFTLKQKHSCLHHLNQALRRSDEFKATYEDWGGQTYHFSAKLNPAEYRENRPVPLEFEEKDIFLRLKKLEDKSGFYVEKVLEIISNLEEIEKEILEARKCSNYNLKKADVLEWGEGSKTQGMEIARDDLIEKLRAELKLPPTPVTSNHGARLDYC